MLLFFVVFYFVVIMAGIVLPVGVLMYWWEGENIVNLDVLIFIGVVAWMLGFWSWVKSFGGENSN